MSVVYLSCLLKKMIQFHFYVLPKLWLIFCCHQQKIHKSTIFNILITITLEVKITIRQANPFFLSTIWALVRWFISSLHFKRSSKLNFKCPPFALCCDSKRPTKFSFKRPPFALCSDSKDLQNSISSVPHLHYVLVCKINVYLPMLTLNIDMRSYIKFANFWYILLFFQFDTNMGPIPWTIIGCCSCMVFIFENAKIPFSFFMFWNFFLFRNFVLQ